MFCKLQRAFGKGLGITREQGDIDSLRPAVAYVVEDRACARQCDEPSTAALDLGRLAPRLGAVRLLRVNGQPVLRQCRKQPVFQRIVGRMDEVGLSWLPYVGTELRR